MQRRKLLRFTDDDTSDCCTSGGEHGVLLFAIGPRIAALPISESSADILGPGGSWRGRSGGGVEGIAISSSRARLGGWFGRVGFGGALTSDET